MKRRLGFIGIIVEDRARSAAAVNDLLSRHGDLIVARLGLPDRTRDLSIISLTIEATTDEIGRLTGELGRLPGVSVKSMLSKER
mgnify:CR=1 FL=1